MKIICLDGIGTKGRVDGSILAHTADHLAAKLDTTAEWIPWTGAMLGVGGAGSWAENAAAGVRMLVDAMDSHHDQVILLAYSGGNKVVHDFLDLYPRYRDRIAACGLMSDPWRPVDRWQHGCPDPRPRYGVMGQRHGPIHGRTFWTTAVDDVISSAWPDALLRYLADTSEGDIDQIITKAIEHGHLGSFQLAWQLGIVQREPFTWFLGLGGRIGQLAADVQGYMTGTHTNGYIEPHRTDDGDDRSLAVRLADSIAWAVRA